MSHKNRRYPQRVLPEPVYWRDGRVIILDQRRLPETEVWIEANTWHEVAEAIRLMAVRGAPLIGVAAAYGLALARQKGHCEKEAAEGLASTRPTAINLFHALERVIRAEDALGEALAIHAEERAANEAIGRNGAALLPQNSRVITLCNTGSLATPGIGTALGVIRTAHTQGKLREAILLETRPRLQGLRLSAWELLKEDLPFRVIVDAAAAWFISKHGADFVFVGADRIASNGDTANKIGTYELAVTAAAHQLPFAVAAPTSTIDTRMPSGENMPIEERDASEITFAGAPDNCPVWNPAFDVTPARLISFIVTERQVHRPPFSF